jgi:hypothetical protein
MEPLYGCPLLPRQSVYWVSHIQLRPLDPQEMLPLVVDLFVQGPDFQL